jgi:hypothetical protein
MPVPATLATQAAWITDNSTSQWGYAMQNISSSTTGADYGGTGLFNAKAFGLGVPMPK